MDEAAAGPNGFVDIYGDRLEPIEVIQSRHLRPRNVPGPLVKFNPAGRALLRLALVRTGSDFSVRVARWTDRLTRSGPWKLFHIRRISPRGFLEPSIASA